MAALATEGRALSAALSAPTPFRTRAGTAALHGAERHVQRYAPEADGEKRRGSLGALAFVDRLVLPWVAPARQSSSLRMFGHYLAHGAGERAAAPVSWLFPRPWYQDELDWMAAARAGVDAEGTLSASGLYTTRGTYAERPSAAAQAAPSPASLGFVAPSLAPAASAPAFDQVWSPLVAGDAAASARLVQIAVAASGDAGRPLATSAMSALAPALIAPAAAPGRAPAALPALRARLAALIAAQDPTAPAAAQPASRLASLAPAQVMPAVTADGFGEARASSPDREDAPRGFERPLEEQHAIRVAEAQRVAADVQRAIAQVDDARQAPAARPEPAPALPLGLRMVELLARGVEAGQAPAPVAGPRLAMPAGLGGLVGVAPALDAIGALASGRPAPAAFAPSAAAAAAAPGARAGAPLALSVLAQARPHALDHVAWSDRWLARMAGAQPRALAAFDAATAAPGLRPLARATAAPAPVFVAPAAPAAAPAVEPVADRVVRYDDTDVTPDEVLFAIAAARSQAPARRPAAPLAAVPAAPARPLVERPTPADAVLTSAPAALGAGLAPALAASPLAPALAGMLPLAPAPAFDVRALFGGEVAAAYLGGLLAAGTFAVDALGAPRAAAPAVSRRAAGAPAMSVVAPVDTGAGAPGPGDEPTVTLRAPLFMPPVELDGDGEPATDAGFVPAPFDEAPVAPLWSARPGMTAERSRRWATHTQESAADLSFDFVPPELVLAARGYGLSPADAAQASRIATGGVTALQVLAGNVEMTFLDMLAAGAGGSGGIDAHARGFAPVTAFPVDGDDAPALTSAIPSAPRRTPRGAFLWPAATAGALGMRSADAGGDSALSVAALELLAASAVAQLGTFAIPPVVATGDAGPALARAGRAATVDPAVEASLDDAEADAAIAAAEPAQRARFQALYLALTQAGPARSAAGQAARAFALAGRGEGGASLSARERAALAWSVLPMIGDGGQVSPEVAAALGLAPAAMAVAGRAPELTPLAATAAPAYGDEPRPDDARAGLAARAGEALSAFVAPVAAAPAPAAASTSAFASPASRAPTAAPELVRTAASGRFGGGETEIPAWFEQAARKMLETRGIGDNLSLAELTLVTAAPPTQIAASSRGQTVTAAAPSPQSMPAKPGMPDIEKIAQEVYAEFLAMMDSVRWRNNGEP
jgi:hypothetical protein